MTHPMEPVCFDQTEPDERGRDHGELWRREIHALAEIRLELLVARGFFNRPQWIDLAHAHLEVLERFDRDLYAELMGIAHGAALEPAYVVILNHYTDLRDIRPAGWSEDPKPDVADPGGCTALYTNGPQGAILGQTWDMHASAEPFVRMIRIRPQGSDHEALVFTLTGCLGMAGLGHGGVGVTINNLTTTDARIGVVWPALVRKMLAQSTAEQAYRLLQRSAVGGGHHYMIADGRRFFGVECSGRHKVLTQQGEKASHLHTNHCFDPVLRQNEQVAPRSSTFARLNAASTLCAQHRPRTVEGIWTVLSSHDGHPAGICSHLFEKYGDLAASKTCGRIVMSLRGGMMRVSRGCSHDHVALELALDRWTRAAECEGAC